MNLTNKKVTLLTMLTWLTLLAITAQISLFILHYQTTDLIDSLIKSSLVTQLWHPVVILPILGFILTQLISIILFIAWIWFISTSCSELCHLSKSSLYWLGLIMWLLSCCAITTFNNLYFSDSFFAQLIRGSGWYNHDYNKIVFIISASILLLITLMAYVNFFWHKKHLTIGSTFLSLGFITIALYFYSPIPTLDASTKTKPNVIFIGLDSLRPDFTSYFGNSSIHTPNIDAFLQSSSVLTEAYSPLARTFPAWMSILTAKHPKHNHARSNLADPKLIVTYDTLAKRLQKQGYETIYATDEKRFSNITKNYGFDRIIGPSMGVNDFLLSSLSDFPLTNILINTPLGQLFFPYNYANRAAAITYDPKSFLHLVNQSLTHRQHKPLFLAIHLCISHWPFTWAHDKQKDNFLLSDRYQSSVEAVDKQLGKLLSLLNNNGLLKNTIVVLLSDHGTTLALKGDRVILEKNYQGNHDQLNWIPIYKLDSHDTEFKSKNNFSFDTSVGQGTDVLSLKQYHVLLAFKSYGFNFKNNIHATRASLLDIAPTILDLLNLPKMQESDGISLVTENKNFQSNRPLFLETGYSVAEIEKTDISVEKVLKQSIGIYNINPITGTLTMSEQAEVAANHDKQRAILSGDWLLAQYPGKIHYKAVFDTRHQLSFSSYQVPAFYVLANIKTGQWTIGLSSNLGKQAPIKQLLRQFKDFYGDEIMEAQH